MSLRLGTNGMLGKADLERVSDNPRVHDVLRSLASALSGDAQVWVSSRAGVPLVVPTGTSAVYAPALVEQALRQGQAVAGSGLMAIPLMIDDAIQGALVVAPRDASGFTLDSLDPWARIVGTIVSAELAKHSLAQELIHRYAEINVLYSIGETIGRSLDLDQVVALVLQESGRIIAAHKGAVILLDEQTQQPSIKASYGLAQEDHLPLLKLAARVIHTGAVEASDSSGHFRCFLSAPLRGNERTLGAVALANKDGDGFFTASDGKLLSAVTHQAASAIENALLHTSTDQELTSRLGELYILQEIDRQLNASLDPQQVLDISLDWALQSTQAVAGSIAILEPDGSARILASRGYPPDVAREGWFCREVVARAIDSNEPLLALDLENEAGGTPTGDGIRSQLAVPILRERKAIGVISLESPIPKGFDESDLEFIVRLADHATVAIENARLFESVKQANEAKSEFVSVVAHELKVPMTAIRGFVGLMEGGAAGTVSPKQREYLGIITANVNRMTALINDLLDLAHLEAGAIQMEKSAVAISDIVGEVTASLRDRISAKEQVLTAEIPGGLHHVWGDPARLEQILVNLVDNAIKYTPPGGRITVRAWEDPDASESDSRFQFVTVQDSGIGIGAEDQKHLFDKFFRADHPAVSGQEGTGLGLSIVENLVKAHEGDIWVESVPGRGSTFGFSLPIAPAPESVPDPAEKGSVGG